ncbi:hypothetical protein D3C73_949530 [compost metagenome]
MFVLIYINPIDEHFAFGSIIETRNQVNDCAFATAGRSDEGDSFTFFSRKADVFDDIIIRIGIFKADISEFNLAD